MENEKDTTLPGGVVCGDDGSSHIVDKRKQFQDDEYMEFQDGTIYSFQ